MRRLKLHIESKEVCEATSCMMTEVSGGSHVMAEVGGGASHAMKARGATESFFYVSGKLIFI